MSWPLSCLYSHIITANKGRVHIVLFYMVVMTCKTGDARPVKGDIKDSFMNPINIVDPKLEGGSFYSFPLNSWLVLPAVNKNNLQGSRSLCNTNNDWLPIL
jgi:hypothetical protein